MKIRDLILSPELKGIIAIGAAIAMYFTPDEIDHIIEGLLSAFGVSTLMLGEKESKK